jgi:hypothetical protein
MRARPLSLFTFAGAAGLALAASAMPASAATGMTVTVERPSLTARVLVTVPVDVVCDPLSGDTVLSDSVQVTLRQAAGRSVSTGSGTVAGGAFSPFGGNAFLTCDGTTHNHVIVNVLPDAGSGPFHGGQAIITVSASHAVGTCPFPGFCQSTGSEGATVGPTAVGISG